MRKNIFLAIFILLFIVCIPAMADKTTRILTAFKENIIPGENAALFVDFQLLDSSSNEIVEGREVNIPQEFRQVSYNPFSWILQGNAFRLITLSFEFYPMVNNNVKPSESQKTSTITYRVDLSHQTTRIGNAAISSYNRALSAQEKTDLTQGSSIKFIYYTNSIPATYDMYYADYYQFSATNATISNNSVTITLTYNFATNTVADGFPAAAQVCNSWNRYGSAAVTLQNINESATNYASGNYEAPVRLTITPDS